MDSKIPHSIKTVVRLLQDDTVDQYESCVQQLSKQCIQILDSTPTEIEGFAKKEKLFYSPSSRPELSSSSPTLQTSAAQVFTFDSILASHLQPDLSHSSLTISVGKGDTLTSRSGLIFSTIASALSESFSIKLTSNYFSQGKLLNYIDGFAIIRSMQEAENLLSFDYFNLKKLREILVVTTLVLEKNSQKVIAQFVDLLQTGKAADLVAKVIINTEEGERLPGEEAVFDLLASSLTLGCRIQVVGNLLPMQPYLQQNKAVLQYLELIEKNKNKLGTFYAGILLKEIKRLNKVAQDLNKSNEDLRSCVEELKVLRRNDEIEATELKEKISKFRKDEEVEKMSKEINAFKESYLIKLAEIAELEIRIKELTEVNMLGRELLEKDVFGGISKQLNFGKSDILSHDIGISPIRSLNLTEKSAMDRIDSLTLELEDTKKQLKFLQDKEELTNFKLPENGIQHLSYYELITNLWRMLETMQTYYNDVLNSTVQKYTAKYAIFSKRDELLRTRLSKSHEIHVAKLAELAETTSELNKAKSSFEECSKRYETLKEKYEKFKTEVSEFKADCKEKMKKAKADVDLIAQLEACEKEIEKVGRERDAIRRECEKDKLEFIENWNMEKSELIRKFEVEKQGLIEKIEILKTLRQPTSKVGRVDSN